MLLFSTPLLASLQKVSIQLEWKHQFQFAGYYVAKEKGYYKNVGLDVEIKEFEDNIDIVSDVLNNNSTFGVSSSSIILHKLQNKPLILVASYFKQNALVLATKPEINSITDLKNKKIMLNSKQLETTSIGAMLQYNNLQKNDYIHVQHNYKIDKFVNGEVDAVSIFISNQLYLLDKLNVKYNILNPSTYGVYSFDGELFTSKDTATNSTEMVDAFAKATNKGWEYAFKHKKEVVDLIYTKYSTKKTKDALLYEAKKIQQLFNTNIFKIGAIVPALTKLNAQMYLNLGLVDKNINISESLSDYFLQNIKLQQQLKEKNIHVANIGTNLSTIEKEYLKQKKQITACIDPSWMPFESFKDGKHIGLTNDYFKKFQEKINTPIKVIQTKTWIESIESAKKRECDIMSLVMETEERKSYLNFTTPYLNIPLVLATKLDVPFITDFNSLEAKVIGIPKGYAFNEILRKRYPKLIILDVKNTKEGLQKVSDGQIFGYIGTLASVGYLFQKEFTGELKIAGKFDEKWELGLGVRNDDPILLSIFEKVINDISETDKQDILNRWIAIKYEKGIDYSLVWQILFISILIIVGTIYWNRRLSLLNTELENARIKAEEATLTKSNFLSNMSHEIRTPLNAIVNMAYILKRKTADKTQLHHIEVIEKASNSLITILNTILDLSKIEANKLELSKVNFNLTELLDNVNNIVKLKAEEKGLTFSIIYDEIDSTTLYGDDLKLTQILINLTSNAVKFTDSGYVKLFVKKISTNRFRFSINDTGIGITKKQIDKLFSPFTQADSSITRKYGGTGLGLSLTKELVELMNGKIWVESVVGAGSRFIFEIEFEGSSAILSKKTTALPKSSKKEKIDKKILSNEEKDDIFSRLVGAVSSRRPNICEEVILEIETYTLSEEDQELFDKVKKVVNQYKFNEAKELLNAK